MPKVILKYCGGCNPKYDRVMFAEKILGKLVSDPGSLPEDGPSAWLVICGCERACVGLPAGAEGAVVCSETEDLGIVLKRLKKQA